MKPKHEQQLERVVAMLTDAMGILDDVRHAVEPSYERRSDKYKQSDEGENMGYNIEDMSNAVGDINCAIDKLNDVINR